jgi:signal peptidase I
MLIAKRLALLVSGLLLVGCGKGGDTTTVIATQGATPTFLGFYRIPSESMDPTLKLGARVQVETGTPRVGEIVVFHPPEGAIAEACGTGARIEPGGAPCSKSISTEANIKFIKRIVAGPGDTLKVVEGHVIRNGRREADSYIRPCPGVAECNFPVAIKVPAGEWYLLGDNRGESDDSRFWGPVPTSWIVGVANLAPGHSQ